MGALEIEDGVMRAVVLKKDGRKGEGSPLGLCYGQTILEIEKSYQIKTIQ